MTHRSCQSHGYTKKSNEKQRKFISFLDQWQNDEIYRACQLMHGWTEEYVKYLDYISHIDIRTDAPYKQRNRHESAFFMRGVDSNKQAGPLCQRPDEKSANVLVGLQREQDQRSNSYFNALADKTKRHIGSNSQTTLRISHHLHAQHGQKVKHGGALHLGTVNDKTDTLKDDKTKYDGISDNPDNVRVTRRLVQGDWYGDVRAKKSQLLSSSSESGFHTQSCGLLRFLFFPTVSRPCSSNCHERDDECTDNTSLYAHTRTLPRYARLRTSDAITLFDSITWRFVCVSKSHFNTAYVFVDCSFDAVSS